MEENKAVDKIEELLTRRVDKIYPSKEALKKVLKSGKKLRLYQGFDPSTPNLHIGHLVGLLKLKEFQELGHEVIFLIGDFTGMIGDPSGKVHTRKALTKEEVLTNAKTYQEQAGLVLKFSGNNPTRLKFNSQWNAKLSWEEGIRLCRHFTFQQVIERDMFQERIKKREELYFNEVLYPLIQGYDSVAMNIDLEIGGSDQMFNMLTGRKLVKELLNKEKFVLTTKLLADNQGTKIGKTEGNAINIANKPEVLFGQIMSLTDDCILPCFELITDVPMSRVGEIKKALKSGENPMLFKKELAGIIVEMLYSANARTSSLSHFEKVFQEKKVPSDLPTFNLDQVKPNPISIVDLLVLTKMASSRSEAKRLVNQGAVELNGLTIKQLNNLTISPNDIIKIGKRKWVRIK